MLNFLLTALAFIVSTATFTLSFAYSGVARTFTSFGKSIAELSIIVPEPVGDFQANPYFDPLEFERMAKEHFDEGLRRYLSPEKSYSLSYVYFDAFSPHRMKTFIKPSGVTMSFKCPVSWFGTYENKVTFVVKEGVSND